MSEFDDLYEKINKMEVEVSALREKVSFFNVIYSKFDTTLDKVQEMMENRRNEINEDLKDVYTRISESETKMLNEFQNLRREVKELHEQQGRKISEIDKWRWMVIGAAGAVGYIISKFLGS